ncbi:hypothetical protein HD806DRAFT_547878 [Xylariaceae sp. AK1471]|nr:hypothetical protein HD806DRAFT_547878 [Xylariaceae sp. AK1471]
MARKEHFNDDADAVSYEQVLEILWPIIEAANVKAPEFGRIPRELVILASPNKPFLRAGKSTIQRRLTIQAYEREIDELYAKMEEGLLVSEITRPSSMEPEGPIPFLEELCSQTLLDKDNDHNISADDDLLTLGLDSLSVFMLLARLKAALRKLGVEGQTIQKIDLKLLYSAPTVRQLSKMIAGLQSSHSGAFRDTMELDKDIDHTMLQLFDKYDTEVRRLTSDHSKEQETNSKLAATRDQVVILTGSTGSLGSYILASLLSRPAVKKVICLNRGTSSSSTQAYSFKSRRLPDLPVNDNNRLKFLQVEPTSS